MNFGKKIKEGGGKVLRKFIYLFIYSINTYLEELVACRSSWAQTFLDSDNKRKEARTMEDSDWGKKIIVEVRLQMGCSYW